MQQPSTDVSTFASSSYVDSHRDTMPPQQCENYPQQFVGVPVAAAMNALQPIGDFFDAQWPYQLPPISQMADQIGPSEFSTTVQHFDEHSYPTLPMNNNEPDQLPALPSALLALLDSANLDNIFHND